MGCNCGGGGFQPDDGLEPADQQVGVLAYDANYTSPPTVIEPPAAEAAKKWDAEQNRTEA